MPESQIQGCVVEQRVEKKGKIAESVWVHNVVTVWTGKVAGQSTTNLTSTNSLPAAGKLNAKLFLHCMW